MLEKGIGMGLRNPGVYADESLLMYHATEHVQSAGGDGYVKASSPFGRLGDHWHTTTFRWLSVYAPIFVMSIMVLIGFIECSVTRSMQSAADSGIRWQLRYFDSIPDAEIATLIDRRLERERKQTNYYALFAPDGSRLAGDIVSMLPGLTLDMPDEGHRLSNGVTRTLRQNSSLTVVRVMGERRADGRLLVVARSLRDVMRIRDELTRALIVGGAVCLLANLMAGVLLSWRQMARIADMRRVTSLISGGDLNQRLDILGRDELDMLAQLVNRMLEEIGRLVRDIKGTCDGIAHDLHTPLIRLRLQLGHLAEHAAQRDDHAASDLIDKVRIEADSVLERFNAMLRISEIGTMQRRSGFGMVAAEMLIEELCGLYQPLADEKFISLSRRVEAVGPLHGDRGLLFEAVSNLLNNAIKFAPVGGEVSVTLAHTPAGATISIEDNGPGIPLDERDAVLKQFYRAQHTSHIPGTGLGLAIVASVVRLHDFELRIGSRMDDKQEAGTVMTIECWPHWKGRSSPRQ